MACNISGYIKVDWLKMGPKKYKFNRGATGMNPNQSPVLEPSISNEATVQSKSKKQILNNGS